MIDSNQYRHNSMFQVLLEKHLQDIKSRDNSRGCILIYKGFPMDFVSKVGQEFQFLNDNPEAIFPGNKIDLQRILESAQQTLIKMLGINSGVYVGIYEELLAIAENVRLSFINASITIVNDNLFDQYPNQTTSNFPNLDQIVEKADLGSSEDLLLNRFYAYSDEIFGQILLQHRIIELEDHPNVSEIEFFTSGAIVEEIAKSPTLIPDQLTQDVIPVSDNDERYFRLKYSLWGDERPTQANIQLITDPISLRDNPRKQLELAYLKYLYTANGYSFDLHLQSTTPSTEYRPEFGDILKRYWNSDRFRELEFYLDPDKNTQKHSLTQAALMEEIVRQVEKSSNNEAFSDVFITSPTGSGKSLLFQIPAIYLHEEHHFVTIIVSPLKALMFDQVSALRNRGVTSAAYINSEYLISPRLGGVAVRAQVGYISYHEFP